MPETPTRRLVVIGLVAGTCFISLFGRLLQLQVGSAQAYTRRSEANRLRVITDPAGRGRMLDRQGRVLADTRMAISVALRRSLDPAQREETFQGLSAILAIPVAELERRAREDRRSSPYESVPVATDVIAEAAERARVLPGIELLKVPVRRYPNGTLGAHLLGYLGEVSPGELAVRSSANYGPGDLVGRAGAEAAFEPWLRGRPGLRRIEVDRRGRAARELAREPAEPGSDVALSIDLDVQRAVEEGLDRAISAARSGGAPAPGGGAVVLDARDGSVLAMASRPTFDPRQLVGSVRGSAWARLNAPRSNAPLTNRVTQGLYAPGSTFKAISALAGLRAGVIAPDTVVVDRGSLEVGDREFHNDKGRTLGPVDLSAALAASSDVYFYSLGEQVWARPASFREAISGTARDFGLGRPTGVELSPEAVGKVPDPAWKQQMNREHPSAFPDGRWYAGDNVNLAIGQGDLLATPLQLAVAYAALGNGGTLPSVTIAASGSPPEASRRAAGDRTAFRALLDPAAREAVISGLVRAVSDPRGTAFAAFSGFPLGRFPVAGKTGTAQTGAPFGTALFLALAPAHSPRYVVAVVVEESGYGGVVAAPVARRALEVLADLPDSAPLGVAAFGILPFTSARFTSAPFTSALFTSALFTSAERRP